MKRALATGFALLQIVVPEAIVDRAERLAFANPDAGRLRPWTIPIARLEGALVVWLLARGSGRSRSLRRTFAAAGIVAALAPRTTVESGLAVSYENAGELELKPWVVPATRLLGLLYVLLGLVPDRVDAPMDRRRVSE